MHHLYPLAKGDPLCPLGFHPQVRWPTRCKRCFRDYKEHGGKRRDEQATLRKDDIASSTPSLSTWSNANENRRSWSSSGNLAFDRENKNTTSSNGGNDFGNPSSWESTPDLSNLNDDTQANIPTVNIKLPKRKQKVIESGQRTVAQNNLHNSFKKFQYEATNYSTLQVNPQVKTKVPGKDDNKDYADAEDETLSIAGTETTDTTLVDQNESDLREQVESLRKELDTIKAKCDRLEKEKSNILLRRLTAMESSSNKNTAAEVLKLQQRCNELQSQLDDYRDEKKILGLKVKELEEELDVRPTAQQAQKIADELRSKLLAAETLCEELMDENEDMKKELRDLEDEMEEMQDNFREDQADEYSSLKKELEQTTKNCRILSFKLRKTERKAEQLETEKTESEKKLQDLSGSQSSSSSNLEKIKNLEKELSNANEKIAGLQKQLDENKTKTETPLLKKKAPMLGSIGRISSDGKVSRESLTRGGSQEDPAQLLRDLQDSLEREADLREQLKFAEEELSSKRLIQPVELPIYKKPSPLVLFNPSSSEIVKKVTVGINTCTCEVVNAYTQSLPIYQGLNVYTQTTRSSQIIFQSYKDVEVQCDIYTDTPQIEKTVHFQNIVETKSTSFKHGELEDKQSFHGFNLAPYRFPSFKSSLHRYQLTLSSMYVPAARFSPMATLLTPMGRKLSPTNNRLSADLPAEKDEGISDDEDVAELKLQLELSEQEASVLRKKVEELEGENNRVKKKSKELQDKLTAKQSKRSIFGSDKEKDEKMKGLQGELETVRKDLLNKEKDCEKLNKELNTSRKRSTELQKIKSSDFDQQTLDLKRQLHVTEQEATVLRTRIQNLESENEKLTAENKKVQLLRGSKKIDKTLDKYIDQIATLEVELNEANNKVKDLESKVKNSGDVAKLKTVEKERDELVETLNKLKQDSANVFKDRTPKRPSELTTKSHLKTMVNDSEKEIGEILVVLNNSESARVKLEKELELLKTESNKSDLEDALKELEDVKKKLAATEKELKMEKSTSTKEKNKTDDLNKKAAKSAEALKNVTEEKDILKIEVGKLRNDYDKLYDEKKKADNDILKLKSDLKTAVSANEEVKKLKTDLQKKEKEISKLKLDTDKEVEMNLKKISDLEKQLRDGEEAIRKSEKSKNLEIKQLEAKLEEEKTRRCSKEQQQSEQSEKWKNDRKSLDAQIDELNNNILTLESTIKSKNLQIKRLEEIIEKERADASSKNSTESKQMKDLRDELAKTKENLRNVESKLDVSQKSKTNLEDKLTRVENDFKREKLNLEKSAETNLLNEKKKLEVLKGNYEKEQKNRELELGILRNKIRNLEATSGAGNKKITEIKQEYQEKINQLESTLNKEKKEYAELTAKYEILEEEHVVTKAKLVSEKESLNNQLLSTKKEMDCLEGELQTLRDTYNTKHDTWIKEKLQMQERLKEFEKFNRNGNNDLERVRLKSSLEETQLELDQLRKEHDVVNDQMEYLRRENEELRKKLDDYDKVTKIQRSISADSSAMDQEIRQLKNKIINIEKNKKSDLAEYKLRYESQIHVINEELRSLQAQVTRFKRERDTYKHMLEGAQKTIGELKTSPSKIVREARNTVPNFDELEEFRTKVATLEQQISCMEDELSEARLESSKVKTELVSERSTYEVKLSELHSRVNELEEEKILSSGRTKIAGLRTRMELAWQKEREEQQRLLQETATLARDLRQTLYEVERERDKERLEARRKLEQLKRTGEDEQEETKRKLTELQFDLLELRDAHAKLRTTNEKLRREKDRHDKERVEMKNLLTGRRKLGQEDEKRISILVEQVEALMQLAPELCGSKESPYTPTPPRRVKGPKSRESSPAIDQRGSKESSVVREDRQAQFRTTLQRLVDAAEDLKRYQKLSEEDRERERIKRVMGMRRATSTEHENTDSTKTPRGLVRNGSSLNRKSLSLEQTSVLQEQNIWKGDSDSVSSMHSLDFASDSESRWTKRDTSLDSRLSGGSTQSEATGNEKKKKKGLIGKLKQLTKSRSIDDQDPGQFSSAEGLSSKPNSTSDINEEKGNKRDLKDRLTGMFKRSGSSSRSNSLERQNKPSSTQRPLMRTDSTSNSNIDSSNFENKRTRK